MSHLGSSYTLYLFGLIGIYPDLFLSYRWDNTWGQFCPELLPCILYYKYYNYYTVEAR